MKRTLIVFAAFLATVFLPNYLSAQTNYEDVIYLKDSSVVRGVIIEQVPNQTVKIQTNQLNVYVYRIDDILKITKEKIQEPPKERKFNFKIESAKDGNIKKSGYTNISEINLGFVVGSSPMDDLALDGAFGDITRNFSIGIQTVNGYQFNPYFNLGAGVGLQFHSIMLMVPLFADMRFTLMPTRFAPYISFAAGYSLTPLDIFGFKEVGDDNKGGILLSPAVGVKFFVKPRLAMNLGLGLRYQEFELYQDLYHNNGSSYTEGYTSETLRMFNVRFGLTF